LLISFIDISFVRKQVKQKARAKWNNRLKAARLIRSWSTKSTKTNNNVKIIDSFKTTKQIDQRIGMKAEILSRVPRLAR